MCILPAHHIGRTETKDLRGLRQTARSHNAPRAHNLARLKPMANTRFGKPTPSTTAKTNQPQPQVLAIDTAAQCG